MSTPELKPCPFCGESVRIDCHGCGDCDPCLGGRPDQCAVAATTYIVGCILCPIHPLLETDTKHDAIEQWNTRHNPAESALNAAREAIENAPHGPDCWETIGERGMNPCDCWKAEALAQIDKALSPQQSKTT